MTLVNPKRPANLFQPGALPALRAQAGVPKSFQLQQQVLATVVELDQDEAVLDIGGERYRTRRDDGLQVGQTLQLQVMKAEPALEFRVLSSSAQERLTQLFPLLSRPFDWSQLAEQLRQFAANTPDLRMLEPLFEQLRQRLSGSGKVPGDLVEKLLLLARQLGDQRPVPVAKGGEVPPPAAQLPAGNPGGGQSGEIARLAKVLTLLREQITTGQQPAGEKPSPPWYARTRDLLGQLQEELRAPQMSAPLAQNIRPVVNQLRQFPHLTPQLNNEIQRLDEVVQKVMSRGVLSQDLVSGTTPRTVSDRSGFPPQPLPGFSGRGPEPDGEVSRVVGELKQIFAGVQGLEPGPAGLPPKIIGQLEGLLARVKEVVALPPGQLAELEGLLQHLVRAADRPSPALFREQLGVLSLLFGFSLGKGLGPGRGPESSRFLEHALLRFRDQLAGGGEEPLQRLELLQWCRERLADEQVQFVPLPFDALEEGYLLIRNRQPTEGEIDTAEEELQLSMALRLSSLGSVRVDMVYDRSGLRLQLAGEGPEKMNFLKKYADELERVMTAVRLVALGFRDDARQPTSQLKKRVLPDADQLLNMRI